MVGIVVSTYTLRARILGSRPGLGKWSLNNASRCQNVWPLEMFSEKGDLFQDNVLYNMFLKTYISGPSR